jgi:hypothetical protein
MAVASALLQRHIETLLRPGEWETLIADGILWELPFAPALGHPGRLEGREAVETHVKWFSGRKLPVLGHSCLSARRPRWRGCGGQSRRAHKGDWPRVPTGIRVFPSCGGREDRVPSRVF